MPVQPHHGLIVRGDRPVRLYWELYELDTAEPAPERLAVTVQVVDVQRRPVPVRRLGEVARAARERPPTLDTRYRVTVPAGTGPLGMTVAIQLPEEAEGIYVARVTVTDRSAGTTWMAERAFRVAADR